MADSARAAAADPSVTVTAAVADAYATCQLDECF
jgi:hypothetical protein